jgi:hypothetical protein
MILAMSLIELVSLSENLTYETAPVLSVATPPLAEPRMGVGMEYLLKYWDWKSRSNIQYFVFQNNLVDKVNFLVYARFNV